ncbi:dual-domain HisK/Mak2 protein kinase [Coprinopsis marcescibilis]|uniref:Dual-domain HisK/Mak2 protein kinase n=1 Tax=Coprinopsis marcescibilis TaxID=230819 RepID=A0A5C3LCA4_COPMA|nr:dual-domain HisK/Mak2 protein kinase [Coprinopsis marcescibilis]
MSLAGDSRAMRRKHGQPTFPTLYFKDGVLSVPGYTLEKAVQWHDTGSMTMLVEGNSLKDGSNVLAKIAPAQSNGSMCLEREAHILGRLTSFSEASNTVLRLIDFFQIPREHGDCVVLLVAHPGPNLLGRYLPASKVNDILLADMGHGRPSSSHGDIMMHDAFEGPSLTAEMEPFDIMDLASFLEFAIKATQCLETLHKAGIIHREVRANAFHLNAHSGFVRVVHFGNRAISLESFGSPSSLVIQTNEEPEKLKVKEALCYLAPEQTGSIETMAQDHRTDLYSLGILFWTLLVGRGQMPFEGAPLEVLHAIVQKRPMPVHEVRRDVPEVLANIIDKLLAKGPDARYQSAYGLRMDLLECQRRLLAVVSSLSGEPQELIPHFEIALQDRFVEFTIPVSLFGRDKELETIRNVIRNTSTSFSQHHSTSKGFVTLSAASTQTADMSDSISSRSASPATTSLASEPIPYVIQDSSIGNETNTSPSRNGPDGLRRAAFRGGRTAYARTQAVIIVGPPGIGKSSIILANQAKWRAHGLWGQAKFQGADSAPFAALLSCLASVLRQLMVFHTDLHRFVAGLQERLGPQMQNVPLLYQGTPELRDVLASNGIVLESPHEPLDSTDLRSRFQSLVEKVFGVIAETRLFALFLDDLHEADDSTLDLVSTLLNSRSRMLIFATLRSDKQEIVDRVRSMFSSKARPTWIFMEPLPYPAILSLISKTMHRTKEACGPLAEFVYKASSGNAFSARSILHTLQRQHHISFDWDRNHWLYDIQAIHGSFVDQHISDPTDLTFLIQHLRSLPEEVRKYITWATLFGETFKVTDVSVMMDWEDSSNGSGSEDETDERNLHKAVSNLREKGSDRTRASMRALQVAQSEGWLVQRARDMCSFVHDRFRQAAQTEANALPPEVKAKMSFRIVLMMLHAQPNVNTIADHANKCIPLLQGHSKKEEVLHILMEAGEFAWARGAHEHAIRSFINARTLLGETPWTTYPDRTLNLLTRLAALHTWKGQLDTSDSILNECYQHAVQPEDKSNIFRLRSRNHWLRNNFTEAFNDTITALNVLGVEICSTPSKRLAESMFEQVKNEILAVGFDEILSIPRTTDRKIELAVTLLNDAGINAYWSPSPLVFLDVIGLKTIELALRSGMAPGTALGFFWALGAAAERREMYRFSADLAKLALRIAERHGSSAEKCRAQVLYCSMVSGFDNTHLRSNIPRLEEALKYGQSAGDSIYTSFAHLHIIVTKLYVCEHLSELTSAVEECTNEIGLLTPGGEPVILAHGILNCIRVLAGYTIGGSIRTLFDTEKFIEAEYVKEIHHKSGNVSLALNWYNSFKLVSFFCVGYYEEAAVLGFSVYETRAAHPNHRHVRYALFFHNLAMIACIRKGDLPSETRAKYFAQIKQNQVYIRKWLSASPVNTSTWVAIIDAEMAAILGDPNAFRLYDVAVRLAGENDWLMEEGWALFLQGSHFVRCGVESLGNELQRRGIARHAQWGAQGIVEHLTSLIGARARPSFKRPIFCSDVSTQTETATTDLSLKSHIHSSRIDSHEDHESMLNASDLASILKWSKEISSDINLSSALQRLTEIATETSGSHNTCVVIAREAGDYIVATSMCAPDPCQVHENPKSIRTIADPLEKAIIQHTLNSKERVFYHDASLDSRFSAEAAQTLHRSVICLPIFSNRGQTFGVVYLASKYPFSQNTLTLLTLLCQQASISISNALLFRSVQAGTRENLKMIAAQREALETARKSREDALKATKIKSNFLASMSHELRTPFSSFYGLLDLLSGTELNPGQSEIVQTAKQSCELLLKIIDSILDYSKLEASAVKLELSGFLVENIIADCMELLLPMAAKKLDLSFNIEPDVPPWVYADYARIRQVLMNLIGNAVKFTAQGHVRVNCSVDTAVKTVPSNSDHDLNLRFEIQDTGIGLTASDVEHLFVPFQQADNSSTRRFGGTGLGLSISRQLVKLMGGAIGVHSEPNSGSTFWFTIPVKINHSAETEEYSQDIVKLKHVLMDPTPLRVLVCSTSDATRSFLSHMFQGFEVTLSSGLDECYEFLKSYQFQTTPMDIVVLDDQSESNPDDMARFIRSLNSHSLQGTKVLHLYTPTTSRTGQDVFGNSSTLGVLKMTKPPRKARMLQFIAGLKHPPNEISTAPKNLVANSGDDQVSGRRTLFGNVLIAEDNPIAQNLLVKQLERYKLNVTATSNGEEAIAAWEAHQPGHFSVALFDHHMPICDGVEAVKRLRTLERKRKCEIILPIAALSADCQESTKQLCLSAGMNTFFSKPLKKNDLLSLLSMFGTPGEGSPG